MAKPQKDHSPWESYTALRRHRVCEAAVIVSSILGSPKGAICHPLDVQAGPEAEESERRSQCVFQTSSVKWGNNQPIRCLVGNTGSEPLCKVGKSKV